MYSALFVSSFRLRINCDFYSEIIFYLDIRVTISSVNIFYLFSVFNYSIC